MEELHNELKYIFTDLGISWSDEVASKAREVIEHHLICYVNKEKDEYNDCYEELMHLFSMYNGEPDSFCSWDDYLKFCTTFAPDFFGFD